MKEGGGETETEREGGEEESNKLFSHLSGFQLGANVRLDTHAKCRVAVLGWAKGGVQAGRRTYTTNVVGVHLWVGGHL